MTQPYNHNLLLSLKSTTDLTIILLMVLQNSKILGDCYPQELVLQKHQSFLLTIFIKAIHVPRKRTSESIFFF